MSFIKAAITTAAVITCCLGNEMPAKANIVNNANNFCKHVVELNRILGSSAAPGSTGEQMLIAYTGHNNFSGYTYGQLYNIAKKLGTSSDCRRMY